MKKFLSITLAICMLFTIAIPAFATDDTILIGTVAELVEFKDNVNAGNKYSGKTIRLTDDIDLGGITWKATGTFSGKLYGDNHTISNFNVDATAARGGFFYKLDYAVVEDLILSDVTATVGTQRFGTLASTINQTSINNVIAKNISVETTKASAWVSGLVASGTVNSDKILNNCTVENFTVNDPYGAQFISGIIAVVQRNGSEADGTNVLDNLNVKNMKVNVNGIVANGSSTAVGGLVGQTQSVWQNPHFKNCSVTGLDVIATGRTDIGGFMAHPGSYTYATNCTVEGKIDASGVTDASNYAGGFFGDYGWGDNIGKGDHLVKFCSADVDIITNVASAGGFVGSGINTEKRNKDITFISCAAKGDVELVEGGTADIGGFAGNVTRGTYISCTSAQDTFIGEVIDSAPIVIKDCDAMVADVCYDTLADAIAACSDDDATVILLKDVVLAEAVEINGSVAIIGDYTIDRADGYTGALFEIADGADLTLSIEHTYNVESATCQIAKICTTCGEEFEGIKEHTFTNYIYNDDATCLADGTKTAECI